MPRSEIDRPNEKRGNDGLVREVLRGEVLRGKSPRTPFVLFSVVNLGLLLLAAVITFIALLALFVPGTL
jgi:hypothetical protein